MSVLTSSDTDPEIADRMVEQWRAMSPTEKFALVTDLCEDVDALARAGIRDRFPEASDREVELRLVSLRVDPELVREAYGWDPEAADE